MPSSDVQYSLLGDADNPSAPPPGTFYSRNTTAIRTCIAVLLASAVVTLVVLSGAINSSLSSHRVTVAALPEDSSTVGAEWWKHDVIYQVYPRSFQDSDGDGTGDIKGIITRLDYLQWLGIRTIWLSPVFASPMTDFGYDVSDYRSIAPMFGTMDDFKELLKEVHSRGMRLILDAVPNHTSEEHAWFTQSEEQPTGKYGDYYVWVDGRCEGEKEKSAATCPPPNNWVSRFGNSSWQWSVKREQYYLHKFLIEQPDLNYRSSAVRKEMEDVFKFWLDIGVDGFRIDALTHLIENDTWPDEPLNAKGVDFPVNSYQHLSHVYTVNQRGTFDIARAWAKMFEDYGRAHDKEIFTVAEMTDQNTVAQDMPYYKTGLSLPFNFALDNWMSGMSALQVRQLIEPWMDLMPTDAWANWVIGNHDTKRFASRLGGTHYTDMGNMLLLTLPGTPTSYMGDEIGMTDVFITYAQSKDPAGCKWGPQGYLKETRDPQRTPMQWDASTPSGGFSTNGETWLPMAGNYTEVNVQRQRDNVNSHVNKYRELLKLRGETAFQKARNLRFYNSTHGFPEPLLAFARRYHRNNMLIVASVAQSTATFALPEEFTACRARFVSGKFGGFKNGDWVAEKTSITMAEGDAFVMEYIHPPHRSIRIMYRNNFDANFSAAPRPIAQQNPPPLFNATYNPSNDHYRFPPPPLPPSDYRNPNRSADPFFIDRRPASKERPYKPWRTPAYDVRYEKFKELATGQPSKSPIGPHNRRITARKSRPLPKVVRASTSTGFQPSEPIYAHHVQPSIRKKLAGTKTTHTMKEMRKVAMEGVKLVEQNERKKAAAKSKQSITSSLPSLKRKSSSSTSSPVIRKSPKVRSPKNASPVVRPAPKSNTQLLVSNVPASATVDQLRALNPEIKYVRYTKKDVRNNTRVLIFDAVWSAAAALNDFRNNPPMINNSYMRVTWKPEVAKPPTVEPDSTTVPSTSTTATAPFEIVDLDGEEGKGEKAKSVSSTLTSYTDGPSNELTPRPVSLTPRSSKESPPKELAAVQPTTKPPRPSAPKLTPLPPVDELDLYGAQSGEFETQSPMSDAAIVERPVSQEEPPQGSINQTPLPDNHLQEMWTLCEREVSLGKEIAAADADVRRHEMAMLAAKTRRERATTEMAFVQKCKGEMLQNCNKP